MSEQIEQQNNKVQPTTEETTVAAEQVAGFPGGKRGLHYT